MRLSIVESLGSHPFHDRKEKIMPYILAWLLGVPAFVLVLIWLFMH
ncbi:hypothetical protein C7417_1552 [Cupriavidus plantarum]|nr:hypothetical protein C7418_0390 [Cupriavidus plantarum]RLK45534.1 hypothetical protein C7417_1552 [Cupriavidus plantarum]SMR66706.1 hypothetical protein SAMN05421735_1592 [Cupriavidus plantarum]